MRKHRTLLVMVTVLALAIVGSVGAAESESRLHKSLEANLNKQVNAEMSSSYLYLSMVSYFESVDLPGFAHWMRLQTQEETTHGMMFFTYIIERNGRVLLTKIDAPKTEWKSPLDAFIGAYEHEIHISKLINKLVSQARDLKDDATDNFLQWFVSEQVEEESAAYRVVQQLRLIGDDRAALFLMDRELAKRQPAPPAQAAPPVQ